MLRYHRGFLPAFALGAGLRASPGKIRKNDAIVRPAWPTGNVPAAACIRPPKSLRLGPPPRDRNATPPLISLVLSVFRRTGFYFTPPKAVGDVRGPSNNFGPADML